jgi:hypothetical protein
VENPATGRFILVHKINWPNNNTTTNFSNPSFSFICSATNTTNNTAIVVKTVSYALFLEGTRQFLGPKYGADATKASITALVPVLSIRNATTYNTVANRSQIRLRQISFSSAANTAGGGGIMTIQVLLNATLTGPSFSAVSGTTADSGVTITSGQSIASTDTTASAVSGGTLLWNACVNSNNGFISFDCTESNIFCGPTDVLTFAIKSSASGTGGVAVNWSEDQ